MKKLLCLIICFLTFNLIVAADSDNVDTKIYDFTPGIIFNTSNLLLDIDEYQSGVGLKLRSESYSVRALLKLRYESGNNTFESNFGLALEKPFFSGMISPYWGISIAGGFEQNDFSTQERTTITGDLSALFGTEVYIFDFLSVFAEYKLGTTISRVKTVNKTTDESSANLNYQIGSELGNNGSIGVVIYLEQRPIMRKND